MLISPKVHSSGFELLEKRTFGETEIEEIMIINDKKG